MHELECIHTDISQTAKMIDVSNVLMLKLTHSLSKYIHMHEALIIDARLQKKLHNVLQANFESDQ